MKNKRRKKKEENEDREGHYLVLGPIQICQEFLGLVQEMMNKGKIEFCKETKGQVVNVLQK